jgi:hypothetical protein
MRMAGAAAAPLGPAQLAAGCQPRGALLFRHGGIFLQ